MTCPAPCPPWSVRQRLRAREVRRTARRGVARLLAALAERLDPPAAIRERAEASVVAEGIAQGRADLQLVHGHRDPLPPVLRGPLNDLAGVTLTGDGWVRCSLGVLTATRPIGAEVLVEPQEGPHRGMRLTGRVVDLRPSELSLVRYVLVVDLDPEPIGLPERVVLDLPLSHPLEVLR